MKINLRDPRVKVLVKGVLYASAGGGLGYLGPALVEEYGVSQLITMASGMILMVAAYLNKAVSDLKK